MTEVIVPLGERVLIEPDAAPTQTASGLILPEKKDVRPTRGTVRAVGQHVQSVHVRVGATVLFNRYAGADFTDAEQRTVLLLDAKDVLAVVTETGDNVVSLPRAN